MPTYTSQLDPYWRQRQMDRFQSSMGMIANAMGQRRQRKFDASMKDVQRGLGLIAENPELAVGDFGKNLIERNEKWNPAIRDYVGAHADRGQYIKEGRGVTKTFDSNVAAKMQEVQDTIENLGAQPDQIALPEGMFGPPSPNFEEEQSMLRAQAELNQPEQLMTEEFMKLPPESRRKMRAWLAANDQVAPPDPFFDPARLSDAGYAAVLSATSPEDKQHALQVAGDMAPRPQVLKEGEATLGRQVSLEKTRTEEIGLRDKKKHQDRLNEEGARQANRWRNINKKNENALAKIKLKNDGADAAKPLNQQTAALHKELYQQAMVDRTSEIEMGLMQTIEGGGGVSEDQLEMGVDLSLVKKTLPMTQSPPPKEVADGLAASVENIWNMGPEVQAQLAEEGFAKPRDLYKHYLRLYGALVTAGGMAPGEASAFIKSGQDIGKVLPPELAQQFLPKQQQPQQ